MFFFIISAARDPYGEYSIVPRDLFDEIDYEKINKHHDYQNHVMNGWSSFKTYLNALTYLLDHQKDLGHNSLAY